MKKVAEKYGLEYKRSGRTFWTSPLSSKNNIIEGTINGHNVSIYDFATTRYSYFFGTLVPIRLTVVNISFVRKKINSSSLSGFGSIEEIDSILADFCKNKG